MKHFPFGSSTAARTDVCQQWRAQSEGVPTRESSYAIDGTIVHGVLEAFALDEAAPDLVEGHRVTQDHRDMAYAMWGATVDVIKQYNLQEWEPEVTASTAPDVGGTLDLVGTDTNGLALLLDYKTGMGVQVEAVGNKQILFAAANTLYGESSASDLVVGCDKFVGVILQPDQSGAIQTKVWEFDRDVLDNFWEHHQRNIEKARCGEGDLKAGYHCKFCPANGLCDATTGNLLKMQQVDPEDAETLAWALDHIDQVEATIKAVKKLAFEQLEVGVNIPGWKLVKGRAGARTWDDPEEMPAKLTRVLRAVKDEEGKRVVSLKEAKEAVVSSKVITPTQAEKLLKKYGAPVDWIKKASHNPPPSNNVLAPADDPREAVLSSDAFAAAINSIK